MMKPDSILTPEFSDLLDKVLDCIKTFQSRGQVVTLDAIAVMMDREHGVQDRALIEDATKELEAQGKIATAPLYWQPK
jgi:hypothetical protein